MKVKIADAIDTNAQSIITWATPILDASGKKIHAPSKAPNFPLAAHIPLRVDRHGREKVMLGSINVCLILRINSFQLDVKCVLNKS